jgi:hypothetical protein
MEMTFGVENQNQIIEENKNISEPTKVGLNNNA